MAKPIHTIIDGDSICYAAAYSESEEDMMAHIDKAMCAIISDTKASRYTVFIEEYRKPKAIFRYKLHVLSSEVTTHAGYKGNRRCKIKPDFLHEAKHYMTSRWNAKVAYEYESEDECLILAKSERVEDKRQVIIAAIDKDLKMHPGVYYCYRKGTHETVSPEQGQLTLWRQVCTGDSTDNVPGVRGIGKAKAEKLVTSHEMGLAQAVKAYKDAKLSYEYFIEQYNLLYIRDERSTEILYPLSREAWDESDR